MTPFMLAVRDLLDGRDGPTPATEASRPGPVAAAADAQVVIRSLTEQLVSEANAVLRERGEVFNLVDDCRPGELTFTVSYRDRSARVQTTVAGRSALARLIVHTEPADEPRRLVGEQEVQALLLSLLVPAPRH